MTNWLLLPFVSGLRRLTGRFWLPGCTRTHARRTAHTHTRTEIHDDIMVLHTFHLMFSSTSTERWWRQKRKCFHLGQFTLNGVELGWPGFVLSPSSPLVNFPVTGVDFIHEISTCSWNVVFFSKSTSFNKKQSLQTKHWILNPPLGLFFPSCGHNPLSYDQLHHQRKKKTAFHIHDDTHVNFAAYVKWPLVAGQRSRLPGWFVFKPSVTHWASTAVPPLPHTPHMSVSTLLLHALTLRKGGVKKKKKKVPCALFVCVYVRAGLFLAPRVHLSPLRQDDDVSMCFLSAAINFVAFRM